MKNKYNKKSKLDIGKIVIVAGAALAFAMGLDKIINNPSKGYYKYSRPTPVVETIEKPKPKFKLEEKVKQYQPIVPINFNYLMTDEEFIDYDYLTKDQIQEFLEQKGSILAKRIEGKLFSEEVIKATKKYEVNPLLLLARAQVEQGLVSETKENKRKLSRVMGYGCLDNGITLRKGLGFSEQIENCARILKKHYDAFEKGAVVIVDGSKKAKVEPRNRATFSLLKYTPWTSNGGNSLFRKVYDNYKTQLD